MKVSFDEFSMSKFSTTYANLIKDELKKRQMTTPIHRKLGGHK